MCCSSHQLELEAETVVYTFLSHTYLEWSIGMVLYIIGLGLGDEKDITVKCAFG